MLYELVDVCSEKMKDKIAIVSQNNIYSYSMIKLYSDRLASMLLDNQLGKGKFIGILMHRGAKTIIAMLAVLKCGGVYIPMNDKWPKYIIKNIAKDCKVDGIILEQNLSNKVDSSLCRLINIDNFAWDEEREVHYNHWNKDENSLTYMLYTSGSTGNPKGVCFNNEAVCEYLKWVRQTFEIDKNDKILSISALTFDISVFEIYGALTNGATLYIPKDQIKILPNDLSRYMEKQRITIIYTVPTMYINLCKRGNLCYRNLNALRWVLFAGEEYDIVSFLELTSCLDQNVKYANLYGPTETNVCAYYVVEPDVLKNMKKIPIGKSISGDGYIVMGEDGNIIKQPDLEGELYIYGKCIMEGYLHNQDKTIWYSDKNIKERAYKTGDIVSIDSNGDLIFHGRKDNMVKISGYRVELLEIKEYIQSIPEVQNVLVTDYKDDIGHKLVAFVISERCDQKELRNKIINVCKEKLPKYAIPSKVLFVPEFEYTDTGKANGKQMIQKYIEIIRK